MTDFSADKLRALDEAASNARPDGDGDFSSYIKAEGALSRYLKECIPAILAMAEREKRKDDEIAKLKAQITGMKIELYGVPAPKNAKAVSIHDLHKQRALGEENT